MDIMQKCGDFFIDFKYYCTEFMISQVKPISSKALFYIDIIFCHKKKSFLGCNWRAGGPEMIFVIFLAYTW